MRRDRRHLLGAVLACAAASGLAGVGPAAAEHRSDRVLYRLVSGRDTVRVIAGMLCTAGDPGWGPDSCFETTETIRAVDGLGQVTYADTLPPGFDDDRRLTARVAAEATPVGWSTGRGVMVSLSHTPSDPLWSDVDACRYFALRKGRLVPVTPWCTACRGDGPGDLVYAEWWAGWFPIRVPARVRLDRPSGGLEFVPERDPRGSGLAVLDIPRLSDLELAFDTYGEFRVRLFRTTYGEGSDVVVVTPRSSIRIGRVFAEIGPAAVEPGYGPVPVLSLPVTVRRLEVTIHGMHGYLEEADFPHIGLRSGE